jgi:hypothetical protein
MLLHIFIKSDNLPPAEDGRSLDNQRAGDLHCQKLGITGYDQRRVRSLTVNVSVNLHEDLHFWTLVWNTVCSGFIVAEIIRQYNVDKSTHIFKSQFTFAVSYAQFSFVVNYAQSIFSVNYAQFTFALIYAQLSFVVNYAQLIFFCKLCPVHFFCKLCPVHFFL